MNACDGLDQVKSLLGLSIPPDLTCCDKFLTVSFRYFASALRLFNDLIWLDRYEIQSGCLKKRVSHFDIHKMAAIMLFNTKRGIYDEPRKIDRLCVQAIEQCWRPSTPVNNNWEMEIKVLLNVLHSMVTCYAGGATITRSGIKFMSTTKVSMTVMPLPYTTQVNTYTYSSAIAI
jgi:hypothetical protein